MRDVDEQSRYDAAVQSTHPFVDHDISHRRYQPSNRGSALVHHPRGLQSRFDCVKRRGEHRRGGSSNAADGKRWERTRRFSARAERPARRTHQLLKHEELDGALGYIPAQHRAPTLVQPEHAVRSDQAPRRRKGASRAGHLTPLLDALRRCVHERCRDTGASTRYAVGDPSFLLRQARHEPLLH